MDWKEILLIPLPIVIPIIFVPLFAVMNMIQPTIAGFDILFLIKTSMYVISPIVYFAWLAFLYFKLKIGFDIKSSIISFIIGAIVITSFIIPLERSLLPSLSSPITTSALELEYRSIFRNILIFNYLYFSIVLIIAVFRKLKH